MLILSALNGCEIDWRITAFLHDLFNSNSVLISIGNIFQYSYFITLIGVFVSLIIIILYLNPKTKSRIRFGSRYAVLFILVLSFSIFDSLILQVIVNRVPYNPSISSLHPYFIVNPSWEGIWVTSFPNNNVLLSGFFILLPVLFGNRGAVFKWIFGILSGSVIIVIAFTEIGFNYAWFSDVFASIGIFLFWSWFFYWHILFIKDGENTEHLKKLTVLFSKAYKKIIDAKSVQNTGNLDDCKILLNEAKEILNNSISSIQNISGDNSKFLDRNKYWKFIVSSLIIELENKTVQSKKWLYIF